MEFRKLIVSKKGFNKGCRELCGCSVYITFKKCVEMGGKRQYFYSLLKDLMLVSLKMDLFVDFYFFVTIFPIRTAGVHAYGANASSYGPMVARQPPRLPHSNRPRPPPDYHSVRKSISPNKGTHDWRPIRFFFSNPVLLKEHHKNGPFYSMMISHIFIQFNC